SARLLGCEGIPSIALEKTHTAEPLSGADAEGLAQVLGAAVLRPPFERSFVDDGLALSVQAALGHSRAPAHGREVAERFARGQRRLGAAAGLAPVAAHFVNNDPGHLEQIGNLKLSVSALEVRSKG